ncbi:MAG TPA: hypothetical protein DCE43_21270 [Planctomycetaceae bacterium]|nr:hypothetical protein [Planctomycetaceae bacterium]
MLDINDSQSHDNRLSIGRVNRREYLPDFRFFGRLVEEQFGGVGISGFRECLDRIGGQCPGLRRGGVFQEGDTGIVGRGRQGRPG